MNEKFYKPSNKFTLFGFVLLIISTAVVGTILSIPYLKLNQVCPFVYLTVLCAFGYGALIGLILNYIIKRLKLRNPTLACSATIIGGMIFTYFKWALYMPILFEDNLKIAFTDIIPHPSFFWDLIRFINEQGTWSISRTSETAITGIPLWIVWICEIIIILSCPIYFVITQSKKPFIEKDDEWAKEYKYEFKFNCSNMKTEKNEIIYSPLKLFNYEPLLLPPTQDDYMKLKLYNSFNYSECYISLYNMKKINKKNNHTEQPIFKYLLVDFNFVDQLFDHFKLPKPFASSNYYDNSSSNNSNHTPENADYLSIKQPPSFEELTTELDNKSN